MTVTGPGGSSSSSSGLLMVKAAGLGLEFARSARVPLRRVVLEIFAPEWSVAIHSTISKVVGPVATSSFTWNVISACSPSFNPKIPGSEIAMSTTTTVTSFVPGVAPSSGPSLMTTSFPSIRVAAPPVARSKVNLVPSKRIFKTNTATNRSGSIDISSGTVTDSPASPEPSPRRISTL